MGEGDKNYYRIQTQRSLPLRWTAPEVLRSRVFNTASDVYAYGIVIYEVFSYAEFPFDHWENDGAFVRFLTNTSAKELHHELIFSVYNVPNPPPPMQQLLEECVKRDPTLRPTFAQIADRTSKPRMVSPPVSRVGGAAASSGGTGGEGSSAVQRGADRLGVDQPGYPDCGYLSIGGKEEAGVAESGL